MDVLSDICSRLRLNAHLYFRADLRAPFSLQVPEEARHVRFHHVLVGEVHVHALADDRGGDASVLLKSGDLVLVPNGEAQLLASDQAPPPPLPLSAVLEACPPQDGVLTVGDGDLVASLLCGYLDFDEALLHPAFTQLPPVLVLRRGEPDTGTALEMLHAEAGRPDAGSSFLLHRIIEMLLVLTLRRQQESSGAPSFFRALKDPRLARALTALHDAPHEDWDVTNLASVAGMSRSRFASRFSESVGQSPHAYLTHWRMTLARELLRSGATDMQEIAERCGYSSLPAFTRRFGSVCGMSPAAWRRQNW
ncbi:MAG: hypothetical protein CMN87_18150 [Stappia sp.]|uniref:AraC family transcriptional regulator n=1 Tax=Stappia sp. TaxID=1870903 RepID=UPI000C4EA983|nr:AraC family transcriptional regulator [Stappia sp.]MAA97395.1 hypothetical protein [Stappia sp.]MBM21928.1 hypothetical protein [Stappia sp.]|tara:strand:+ start:829 stop:1749 length:921 start_codon:yes stop_codon:yes gene_type:complete